MAVVVSKKCPFFVIVLLVHVTGSRGLVFRSRSTYRHLGLPPQIVSELVGQQHRQQQLQHLQQQQQEHARNTDCFLNQCDDVDADVALTSSTVDDERGMAAQHDYSPRKRFIYLRPNWIVEKHSGSTTAEVAKNRFTPWGGKRGDDSVEFGNGEGKVETRRDFHPWGGKRTEEELYQKRDFYPWGGKRGLEDEKTTVFSDSV